ncbi:MAG: PGPGW domain-containing protein [Geminicoccaceae bacterium]
MAETGGAFVKTILLQAVGYFFLVVGVIGLVVPVLQGILCLTIGLIILAKTAPWAERLLERFRQRYPQAGATIDKADVKVHEWGRKAAAFFSGKP